MSRPKLPDVSSLYGAPMGRPAEFRTDGGRSAPAAQHKRELMAMGQTAYRLARAAILKAKGSP